MNLYKRPEKELWMGVPVKERVLEAIYKSRGDYMHLIYELWQEDAIPEQVYLKEIKKRRVDKSS